MYITRQDLNYLNIDFSEEDQSQPDLFPWKLLQDRTLEDVCEKKFFWLIFNKINHKMPEDLNITYFYDAEIDKLIVKKYFKSLKDYQKFEFKNLKMNKVDLYEIALKLIFIAKNYDLNFNKIHSI